MNSSKEPDRPPNISLDRTGDAGRVWRDCCMLRTYPGQGGAWPRPISSRALGSMNATCIEVDNTESNSIFEFTLRPDTGDTPWWRDLEIKGVPAYRLSNICDTCPVILSQENPADMPVAPEEISNLLSAGLHEIREDVVETVLRILPTGRYVVGLLKIRPTTGGSAAEYFRRRGGDIYQCNHQKLFPAGQFTELALPIVKQAAMNGERIQHFKDKMKRGAQPTVLALSLVDIRRPAGREKDWNLLHIILDGHHKLRAAAEDRREISLLSFLFRDQSWASDHSLEATVDFKYRQSGPLRFDD
jgi:hypothetical protein